MSVLLSTIITRVRQKLQEPTESFWSDAEILHEINGGIADLWRAVNVQFDDYFLTVDTTTMSIAANSLVVAGVPTDVAVLRYIQPRTPSSYPYVRFEARAHNHPVFIAAREADAQDPANIGVICFAMTGDSAPVGAPTIRIAPALTSTMLLQVGYVKALPAKAASDANPIPGESDKALEFRAIAFCRAKIREDQSPDPDWLALYATEKANVLTFTSPRQEMDDLYVDALFQDLW